jgi:acyl-CoA thioesterase I
LGSNIQAIFDRAKQLQPRPRLVLLGMRMPPNYGRVYADRFQQVYRDVARRNGAVLVPFLLEGVGGVAVLNQSDGIHPTAEGQRRIAETVWRALEPVLKKTEKTERTQKTERTEKTENPEKAERADKAGRPSG